MAQSDRHHAYINAILHLMNRPSPHREFQTTQWSIVLDSRRNAHVDSALQQQSLRALCEQYWSPLYAYLRRKGHCRDDAADLVQGFFVDLIENDFLSAVDRDRGRFRWFLMHAVNCYVSKQRQRAAAKKRGGDRKRFSIDAEQAERVYANEPVDGWTAEKLFDRRWGIEVLRLAFETLKSEYVAKSPELFASLQDRLTIEADSAESYASIAASQGMTEGAVKTAAMRMRQRYRLLLRRLVSDTLNEPDEIEDELEVLLAAIRGQ